MQTDTAWSLSDRLESQLVEPTANAYVVQMPDGTVETVSKTALNELCYETELLSVGEYGRPRVSFSGVLPGDHDVTVTTTIDVSDESVAVAVDSDETATSQEITGGLLTELIGVVTSTELERDDAVQIDVGEFQYPIRSEVAQEIFEVFEQATQDRVDEDVLAEFAELYPVTIRDDGWVIEDTFLITYDATTQLLTDVVPTETTGGEVRPYESDPQVVWIDYDLDPHTFVDTPAGETVMLSESEQRFLATVEVLDDPETHLGVEQFCRSFIGTIEELKADTATPADVRQLASQVSVTQFMDPVSGLIHHHNPDKHTLTATFGVRRWVLDEMYYSEWDHAGLHELAAMRSWLAGRRTEVFRGADEFDETFRKINQAATHNNAPVPDHVYDQINSRWG